MSDKPKILYVDDEKINLMLFKYNFKNNYTVLTALNGKIGLEVLESNPDIMVIICDMKMPVMNGYDFITKAKTVYPDKKFFMLSGYNITDEIEKAVDEGIILKYFTKPFDIQSMHDAIEKVIDIP
ncbi:MAG: response regulator [Winogradskyella sp.]|uniref:response regulator n=1 Tax=Winogradskyella sp. TaxID=1883156 RepID=UPI0025FB1B15|nr:response regulator [Winogradskyella sp.]NRB60035.1 response regulator [Winogradskyella sp.]